MRRFVILSGCLFLAVTLWSSMASSATGVQGVDWAYAEIWGNCSTSIDTPENCSSVSTPPSPRDINLTLTSTTETLFYRRSAYCSPYTGKPSSGMTYIVQEGITAICYKVPPPTCEAPNYIEVVTGECVPPEEICFTELESMADECVYIGEDDPADEVPPGCVVDVQTGAEICLSEEPGCYVADGKTICPTPDMVCGTKNGTFSCVAPEQEGCGYFNGERVCFTPDGEKVEDTSPDHPDNGGNLDGDETNDMIDSRPPAEGGDPDNQIDSPIAPTEPGDEATEKTARDQLKELKKINDALDEMGKGEPLKGDEASSKIDDAIPGLLDNTGIDGLTDGLGTNPFGSGDLGTLPGIADGLMPQGTCIAYSQDIIGFGTFQITCDDTALLRTILSWLFYVITAIYLFQLATTPVRS